MHLQNFAYEISGQILLQENKSYENKSMLFFDINW